MQRACPPRYTSRLTATREPRARRFDLSLVVGDRGAEPQVRGAVRGGAGHHVGLPQPRHRLAGVDAAHLTADHAGGQVGGARRDERDTVDPGEAVLEPGREVVGAGGDPVAADRGVQVERVGERPPVLEAVVAARRRGRPGAAAGRCRAEPDAEASAANVGITGMNRAHPPRCPRPGRCRAGRTTTCGSRRRGSRSRARPGSPSRRRSRARRRRTAAPSPAPAHREGVGHRPDRQLHAGAGVDPGDGDDPGRAVDGSDQTGHDLVDAWPSPGRRTAAPGARSRRRARRAAAATRGWSRSRARW